MAKLTGVELSTYQQVLEDSAQFPELFPYPIRAKKSPASAAKLARKARARAVGWSQQTRRAQTMWHLMAVTQINAIIQVHKRIAQIIQIERADKEGALVDENILDTVRLHGSFGAWKRSIIAMALFELRHIKADIHRSHGFIPG